MFYFKSKNTCKEILLGKSFLIFFLIFIANTVFADDIKQEKGMAEGPAAPKPPVMPEKPVVPGAPPKFEFPKIPPRPSFSDSDEQAGRQAREIEKYNLNVTGAFHGGDTRYNIANTIVNAQYILYSNKTIAIKFNFNNGSEYIYHLRNPRSKTEISRGNFRETYEVTVQVDREFLMNQYSGELYYNENSVTSLSLIRDNKTAVLIVFVKKQS